MDWLFIPDKERTSIAKAARSLRLCSIFPFAAPIVAQACRRSKSMYSLTSTQIRSALSQRAAITPGKKVIHEPRVIRGGGGGCDI
jgi:hypothetical protein